MPKLIKMPSIPQFRNVITDIGHVARYKGQDENDEPIYDRNAKMPTVRFSGTVKLHGTNASCCYDGENLWAQSKGNIITPEKDNAGFAFFVEGHREYFLKIMKELMFADKNTEIEKLCIYGEWAGKGIQKGVAISEIEKTFFMFGIKFKVAGEDDFRWVERPSVALNAISDKNHIRSMFEFETFSIDIDFEHPELAKGELVKFTDEVEKMCPVGKALGVEGIGEGIVYTGFFKDQRFVFKVKGDKHSKSKVKTLAPVDIEREQLKVDFVNEHACKGWRLEQMYAETFDTINGGKGDVKRTGDFLRAVIKDVMKEELDIMTELGLEPKEINSKISKVARDWFMDKLDEEAGL